jgi:nucleotide-binding universal stress UspA family protein
MPEKIDPLRILWAIDPFENETDTRKRVVATLKQLAESIPVSIEPAYVLSPTEFDLNFAFSATWSREYQEKAERMLTQYLGKQKIPGLLAPKILVERKPSLGQSVRTLLNYAKRSKCNLVSIGTHSRKGLMRVFLGSFAETLMLYSEVPLLIMGPHTTNKEMNHILFATDLEKGANILFEKVLSLAQNLGAKITLFHAIPHPIEPVVQTGVYLLSGGWVAWPDFISKEEDEKRKIAERFGEIAKRRGVRFDLIIDSSHTGITSLILKHSKKGKASMIAMAAESGPVTAAIVGSTTRQVVREAQCPVWVMRH